MAISSTRGREIGSPIMATTAREGIIANAKNAFTDAYGAVLINARREVLLRQPAGQFGGYAWTFAKGRPCAAERPIEAALHHALKDTGWHAEILAGIPGVFAGSTSTSRFFLAGRVGRQGDHDPETAALRWASFEAAADLIRESPNEIGRQRDLAILTAAEQVVTGLMWSDRPAACEEDWPDLRPLPERRAEIAIDLRYGDDAMCRIRKGFLPVDQDEKWFIWFGDDVLHLHRSWTGICIYEVRFVQDAAGWKATAALVNRDPEQYGATDDDEDRRTLIEMIDLHLLNDDYEHPQPFGGALALAVQPNYLGSPKVVSSLIQTVVQSAIQHSQGKNNFNGVWNVVWRLSGEIAEGDAYVRMPGWHTPSNLGQALLKAFRIMPEPLSNDDLQYHVSEALMSIYLKVRELLVAFSAHPAAEWERHALPQINALHHWAVTVFLGTNDLMSPGIDVEDFRWKSAAA